MMNTWNTQISSLPEPHLLQTAQWGDFKAQHGWTSIPKVWKDANGRIQAAALILKRKLSFAACLSVMYIPKGPLLDWSDDDLRKRVLTDIHALAKEHAAIFIKIDADVLLGTGAFHEGEVHDSESERDEVTESPMGAMVVKELKECGWRFSEEQIQFRNSVLLDLTATEEEMLARMKQKTRYNVRLAARKGVRVRKGDLDDLALLYRMYAETSLRDGFIIRKEAYYHSLWESFMQAGMATPLIAEVEGEAVAAIVLFHFAQRAWYLHGMSRSAHREKMPNYLIQWEAMRYAKELGCSVYDLWGAPNEFTAQDSMWGVYQFKRGLGGYVQRTMGAFDLPIQPFIYRLYTQILPRLLAVLRRYAHFIKR